LDISQLNCREARVTENICGCDESKTWKARALAAEDRAVSAEAKLQLVHSHVKGIGRRVGDVVAMVEEAFPPLSEVVKEFQAAAPDAFSDMDESLARMGRGPAINSEFAEVGEEGAFTELTDDSERRVPGEYREEVLASGKVEATANWMAGLMPPKSERP